MHKQHNYYWSYLIENQYTLRKYLTYVTLDKSDAYDYLRVDSGLLHGYI